MAELDIRTVTGGPLEVNTYVVGPEGGDSCVLIDPGAEPERVREAVDGRKVEAVLLTHAHFDHMLHARPWLERGAKLYVHALDAQALRSPALNLSQVINTSLVLPQADVLLQDGDVGLELFGAGVGVVHHFLDAFLVILVRHLADGLDIGVGQFLGELGVARTDGDGDDARVALKLELRAGEDRVKLVVADARRVRAELVLLVVVVDDALEHLRRTPGRQARVEDFGIVVAEVLLQLVQDAVHAARRLADVHRELARRLED